MTRHTDEELDALVERAADAIDRVKPSGILSNNAKLSAALFALYDLLPAITSLRTQLAEVIHMLALSKLTTEAVLARAERAEAALAAQIEAPNARVKGGEA